MKKNLIIVVAGLVALALVGGVISCGSGGEQPGQNSDEPASDAARGVCGTPWDQDRPAKVRSQILKEMSENLRQQHEKKAFEIKPVRKHNYIVLYVEGEIHGVDELKNFANKLNDFGDNGCVKKVVLVPKGSFDKGTFQTDAGFEWTSCPYPTQPCPTGECGCRKDANSNTNSPSSPVGNLANGGQTSTNGRETNLNTANIR